MSNKVTFILNRSFNGDLYALALSNHVWIVGSESNKNLAKKFWNNYKDLNYPDQGITTTNDGEDLTSLLYDYLDEINIHHNLYSTDNPWEQIEIVGLNSLEVEINKIRECLEDFSLTIIPNENGFIIKKYAQQDDAPEPASPAR